MFNPYYIYFVSVAKKLFLVSRHVSKNENGNKIDEKIFGAQNRNWPTNKPQIAIFVVNNRQIHFQSAAVDSLREHRRSRCHLFAIVL